LNIDVKNKLQKYGYEIIKPLGSGSFGTAYLLKNGNVLKETEDDKEATASNVLVGRKTKNIAHIFRVFRFKDRWSFYFIEQEQLYGDEKAIEDKLMKEFLVTPSISKYAKVFDPMYRYHQDENDELRYPYETTIYRALMKYFSKNEFRDVIRKFIDGANLTSNIKDFANDLMSAADELTKYNIVWNDLHEGNIRRDKAGTYKIIDLGVSHTDTDKEIEMLERKYD
jgi:serine/threonine protein kinase